MIGRRERLSYAAGDLGFNLVWQTIELYLFFFYLEVLGLPLGVAAGIFLVGAITDWLIDPVIGALADRGGARWPLRLWVLASGPLVAVALALAFAVPPLTGTPLAGYAAGSHVLLRLAYGTGNIPYAALTARMTGDPATQMRLTGVRMQGAAIGGIVAALVHAALATGGESRFLLGAAILGGLAQPCFLATWAGVRERIVPAADPAPLALGRELRAYAGLVGSNPALRRLLVTIVAAGLSSTLTTKAILLLFDRDLGAGGWGYWAALLPSLALLVTTPGWLALARRRGRPETLTLAVLLHGAAIAGLVVAAGGIAAATLALVIAVAASSGMSLMFWALVPETIGAIEAASASGCAARVYALATTARKLGQALAPQLLAASLALTGGAAVGGGSVLPALVVAAMVCAAAVIGYRPGTRGLGQLA